jgi:leucyl-tRNA synthetase
MADNGYDPQSIEEKWQKVWNERGVFACDVDHDKEKYYVLEMFPYPSGRIHMGHVRVYTIGDVLARVLRMKGLNVIHPMGWDAFGLPAENAAIKHNTHPAKWTYENIAYMRTQLQRLGYSLDWSRELATCDPDYYRWEQLFFVRLFERGLAYRKKSPQNWCPSCHTVLANEQVEEGLCWRCDSGVEQKDLTQWFLRITEYADQLLDDLDTLEDGWPDKVTTMQRNWIGKSYGSEIDFGVDGESMDIRVFTTRPDTLYGATFMSVAPEHPLLPELVEGKPEAAAVMEFVEKIRNMDKTVRTADDLEKEGVFTGSYCVNPVTGAKMPIFAANFVLMDYGTGAVMAVPAHDQRDFEFAKKYDLPLQVVIQPEGETLDAATMEAAYTEPGTLVNSGAFDGLQNEDAKGKITEHLAEEGLGLKTVNYRLRDWNISRQRFWGAPIPMIHCDKCGVVPVPEEDLPVKLPEDVAPHADGRSPLPDTPSFVNTICPTCGEPAKRDTDTMDTFVESSWYFLRYACANENERPFDPEAVKYWLPVDQYIGGVEHAILHLMYARFFVKILRDMGFVDFDEPFKRLLSQGMVLKEGSKMSKSKGNIIDPDEMIKRFGADTVRLFILFAAPPEKELDWNDQGIEGMSRFLNRLWRVCTESMEHLKPVGPCADPAEHGIELSSKAKDLRRKEHETVDRVGRDFSERLHFNTGVAAVMELVNFISAEREALLASEDGKFAMSSAIASVVTVISPAAPHVCEELWTMLGYESLLATDPWPTADEKAMTADELTIVVQVNGKLRGRVTVPASASKDEIEEAAKAEPNVVKFTEGKTLRKVIVVPGKLVNIIVG